jgi:hypothetical protein
MLLPVLLLQTIKQSNNQTIIQSYNQTIIQSYNHTLDVIFISFNDGI